MINLYIYNIVWFIYVKNFHAMFNLFGYLFTYLLMSLFICFAAINIY